MPVIGIALKCPNVVSGYIAAKQLHSRVKYNTSRHVDRPLTTSYRASILHLSDTQSLSEDRRQSFASIQYLRLNAAFEKGFLWNL